MSTIRTAQAFGTQSRLASLYDITIQKAYNADRRGAVAQGIGLAGFFFSLYAAYALGEFCALWIPQTYSLYVHIQRLVLGPRSSMRAMLLLARL